MSLLTDIVAYWKLDESSGNAADSVASYDLTNINTVGYSSALINNGADYGTANTNKYLTINDALGIDGGSITISAWVKMRTEISTGEQRFFSQQNSNSKTGYFVGYAYNGGTRRLVFYRSKNWVGTAVAYYEITLGTSDFCHIVLTYDGTNLGGYVNNVAITPVSASGSGTNAGVSSVAIGATRDPGEGTVALHSSTIIDEVGLWSRALTSAEVTALYNSGDGLAYPFSAGTTFIPTITIF